MRLFSKLLLVIIVFSSSSIVFAYDYPVVGEYNANYQKVFDDIKVGRCDGMEGDLKTLADAEGISPNIYLSICYFEKADNDKAFAVFDTMLTGQEYDEVLYVSQSQMDKGNPDPRLVKYRGLAYFNIGAFDKALGDFDAYLAKYEDADVRFSLVDIHISLKNFDTAAQVLDKSQVKNGRYFYRKGRIALRTGQMNTALKNLRMVTPQDEKVYPSAKMLIGEICSGTRRYICAEKEYKLAGATEEYADMAKDKLKAMEDSQRLFSGFLSIGEQYDTNVTSIDQDEIPGASEVASARTYAVADLKLNFFPSFADRMVLGTMHYFTWNDRIPSYDMSLHRVYASLRQGYDNWELVLPKISATIIYLDDKRYSTAVSGEASVTYKMDSWTFSVPLKVTRSNYEDDEINGELSKDGYKYEGEFDISKTIKIFTLKAGLGYAIDDVSGYMKKKNDTVFNASLSARVTPKLTPTLGFNYANYDYTKVDREDEYYSVSLKAVYIITPHIFLGGGVTWTETDSNENAYDYEKTVSELSVSYSF